MMARSDLLTARFKVRIPGPEPNFRYRSQISYWKPTALSGGALLAYSNRVATHVAARARRRTRCPQPKAAPPTRSILIPAINSHKPVDTSAIRIGREASTLTSAGVLGAASSVNQAVRYTTDANRPQPDRIRGM